MMRGLSASRPVSVGGVLNGLLGFTVLFPFVPALIRSTDTQPTFLVLLVLALAFGFAAPLSGARAHQVSVYRFCAALLAVAALYACLVVANATQDGSTLPTRLLAFVQFLAAAIWAYATRFEIDGKSLWRALVVYAVFTMVFFAANGAIEDALIRSRAEVASDLFAAGRGARTLAPEPAFFALQVFNIFVLSRVLRIDRSFTRKQRLLFVGLITFCLLASFSAFGALLAPIVLFAFYPRTVVVAAVVVFSAFGALYDLLPNWESIRAVRVVMALVESRGEVAQLMLLDASFASRLGSFLAYVNSFRAHPIIGEGFSLYQGGGFVSIVSAFGILGLLLVATLPIRIVGGRYQLTTKLVLLAWFVLNFISGPIGVPIIGVIVGKLFAENRTGRQSVPIAGGPDRAVVMAT